MNVMVTVEEALAALRNLELVDCHNWSDEDLVAYGSTLGDASYLVKVEAHKRMSERGARTIEGETMQFTRHDSKDRVLPSQSWIGLEKRGR